ncbi:MAG: SURF1 family protein [Gemmatimonadaceae bacterium]
MRRRMIAFSVIALALAALFVRLGIWQLDRRHERRARNARIAAQAAALPVAFDAVPSDTARAHYRRATLRGVPDYEHELVLASRTRSGSPGVHVLTPVRVSGRDTAILVNRGWVFSPDGATADLARWREGDTLVVEGYVEPIAAGDVEPIRGRVLRQVTLAGVRGALPYPVAPMYLVVQRPGDSANVRPARLTLPDLNDEGPHLGYALQWFAFALIAVIGAGIAVRKRVG